MIATWTLQGYSCYRQAIGVNSSAFGSNPIFPGACSDERPGLKGFAPFGATQLDRSEARMTDQAQLDGLKRGFWLYNSLH